MWEAIQEIPWLGLGLAVVILASYGMYRRELSVVSRQLKRQALKRGGHVRYPWFHYPRLTFHDGGTEITVSAMHGTKHSGPSTFTDFSMVGLRPYGFRIDPHSAPPGRSRYPVARTGNATFDEAFLVHATDEAFLHRVLTPEAQADLLEYQGRNREVNVQVTEPRPGRPQHEGRLWVSVDGIANREHEYDRLIDTAILFRRRVGNVLSDAQ